MKSNSVENFSVRLRVGTKAFIFGFNVGRPDEYWRIGTEKEKYPDEAMAIEAFQKRTRARKKAA